MRCWKIVVVIVMLTMLASIAVSAGDTVIDPSHRYMLLATSKTSTMQKELDSAAEKGFRLAMGSGLESNEVAMMMERIPEGSEKYSYKLLATTRTGSMEKEINSIANEGYRLHPRTLSSKTGMLSREIVVIMEKDPNQKGHQYEYKLLATTLTGTLQKEMTEAAQEGYTLVSFGTRGEHLAIMERVKKP
ncbi:MAG TPA: hypothetical protein VFU86_20490 [Terriglobales bacterium]|nr:hypothetical protein [Terriglobales bacterium]